MKLTFLSISHLILLLLIDTSAFGHGFELGLRSDQITAESEVPTISPHLFVEEFNAFSATQQFTDHGSVEVADDAGFHLPGDALSLEFLGPLWYSGGGTAQRAGAGLSLVGTSFDTSVTPNAVLGSVTLTGASTDPGTFSVVGNDDHSIGWILSGSTIPAGAYGFSYRVTGSHGNPQTRFQSSVPLVVVFSTPGFTGSPAGTLNEAQQSIFNAALRGDFNLDGKLTIADVGVMLASLADLNGYQLAGDLPDADLLAIGDLDRSGAISNADLQSLLQLLASGGQSPQTVPEPSAILLAFLAVAQLFLPQWRHALACA